MKLKELRKDRKLTQEEVAKAINISRSNYGRYELKLVDPSIETLIKLADFYKVTVDELIGHEVPYLIKKIDFSNDQLVLVENIKRLDSVQCSKTLAYIEGLIEGKR